MENNPNSLDCAFIPRRCILHSTKIGETFRENRKIFLHKGAYHKLKGYSYAQLSKIGSKSNASNPKRQADIETYGWDTKFGYHVVRLVLQCEQILMEHDLDLERDREIYKSIRRGEWTLDRLQSFFAKKEKQLEELYVKSTLRNCPDDVVIKTLLLNLIEEHYGSISEYLRNDNTNSLIKDIDSVILKYR